MLRQCQQQQKLQPSMSLVLYTIKKKLKRWKMTIFFIIVNIKPNLT